MDGSVILDESTDSIEDSDDFLDSSSSCDEYPHDEVAL